MYGYVRRSTNTTRYAHFHFAFNILYDDGFVAKHQPLDRYEVKRKKERHRERIVETEKPKGNMKKQPTTCRTFIVADDTLNSKRIVLKVLHQSATGNFNVEPENENLVQNKYDWHTFNKSTIHKNKCHNVLMAKSFLKIFAISYSVQLNIICL